MADMLSLLIILKFKPEHRQDIFNKLKDRPDGIPLTRAAKGAISIEGRMSTDDDETIVLWEKWTSKEDQAAYLKMRDDTDFFKTFFGDTMSAPPVFMHLSKESF